MSHRKSKNLQKLVREEAERLEARAALNRKLLLFPYLLVAATFALGVAWVYNLFFGDVPAPTTCTCGQITLQADSSKFRSFDVYTTRFDGNGRLMVAFTTQAGTVAPVSFDIEAPASSTVHFDRDYADIRVSRVAAPSDHSGIARYRIEFLKLSGPWAVPGSHAFVAGSWAVVDPALPSFQYNVPYVEIELANPVVVENQATLSYSVPMIGFEPTGGARQPKLTVHLVDRFTDVVFTKQDPTPIPESPYPEWTADSGSISAIGYGTRPGNAITVLASIVATGIALTPLLATRAVYGSSIAIKTSRAMAARRPRRERRRK